jgi:hypothetical protein
MNKRTSTTTHLITPSSVPLSNSGCHRTLFATPEPGLSDIATPAKPYSYIYLLSTIFGANPPQVAAFCSWITSLTSSSL